MLPAGSWLPKGRRRGKSDGAVDAQSFVPTPMRKRELGGGERQKGSSRGTFFRGAEEAFPSSRMLYLLRTFSTI